MTTETSVDKQEIRTFGAILRRERQMRAISLREVANTTKISIRFLEALERDDFGALPGGAFNKGFLRAYSEFIGLDPEEMVNHYLFELAAQRHEPESERERGPDHAQASRRRGVLVAGMVVAGIVLVLAGCWMFGGSA